LKARKDRFGRRIDGLRELAFKIMKPAGPKSRSVNAMKVRAPILSISLGTEFAIGRQRDRIVEATHPTDCPRQFLALLDR
jgi:hypothetical protein